MSRRVSKVFRAKPKEFPNISEGFDRRLLSQSDDLAQYGVAGDIVATSYDQVQSLLAIATTKHIHVLGQNGVEVVFDVAAGRAVAHLELHGPHLVAIDSKNTLYTWILEGNESQPVAIQALSGVVTTTYVDPALDWLFLGTKEGTVLAWDLEAEQMNTSFKIKNQYFERQEEWRLMEEWYAVPRYHISPIVSICIHPLDLGMLLITYADGASLYSLKEAKSKRFFECVIAADGNDPARKPGLTCASFSPDGEFVLIGCVDGTFAFFEYREGETPLQVRNLVESDVNLPRKHLARDEDPLYLDPITDLKWCCRQEPGDSFLLVAGGCAMGLKGVSLLDFGKPPLKAQELPDYFATPQRQRILPIDHKNMVVGLETLGTVSAYHNAHNPRCVMLITSSGVSSMLALPSGEPMSLSALHPTLGFNMPPISMFSLSGTSRHTHSQLRDAAHRKALSEKSVLIGGASNLTGLPMAEAKQILCTVHGGTRVRMYDISQKALLAPPLAEIDASLTLPNTVIDRVVFSGATGELALAAESGILVIYRFSVGSTQDDLADAMVDLSMVDAMPSPVKRAENMLYKFDTRAASSTGFRPLCVLPALQGQITSLTVSEIGFVAIGYETGLVLLLDLRGPAIFFAADCSDLTDKKERTFFRKAEVSSPRAGSVEHVTASSFMVVNLDDRLSLTAFLGTSEGRCICLELLKEQNGIYSAVLNEVSTVNSGSAVKALIGCNVFGEDTSATGAHLSSLHLDAEDPDCLLVVSGEGVTSFNGLFKKVGKCTFRGSGAASAQIVRTPDAHLSVLAVAQISGEVEVFSIPELRSLGSTQTTCYSAQMDKVITATGDLVMLTDKNELSLMNIFGTGIKRGKRPPAALYDPLKQSTIPRPTISNWAWVTGTQWVRPADMDLLISGGQRPLSKRALERIAASDRQQALLERQSIAQGKAASDRKVLESTRNAGGNSRTSGRNAYGDMQRGGEERGERVGQVNEMLENITKASGEWLNEIDKFTSSAKKSAGKAALRSLIGF